MKNKKGTKREGALTLSVFLAISAASLAPGLVALPLDSHHSRTGEHGMKEEEQKIEWQLE